MNLITIVDYLAKTFLVIAGIAIVVAFLESAAQLVGKSLVFEMYTPGRLIELAAMLLIFVIAVQLLQIRDELKTTRQ